MLKDLTLCAISVGLLSFCCLCCASFLFLECLLVASSLVSWVRLPRRLEERGILLAIVGVVAPAIYVIATVAPLHDKLVPESRKLYVLRTSTA